jgi:tryptophan synthase beta chain
MAWADSGAGTTPSDLAKKLPDGSVIAFNLSGHGLLDADAYEKFLA